MRKPLYFTVCVIITSVILAASCTQKTEPEAFSHLGENRIEPLAKYIEGNNTDSFASLDEILHHMKHNPATIIDPKMSIEFVPPTIEPDIDPDLPSPKEYEEMEIQKEKKPYMSVEQMPEFPGGREALKEYIYSNLHYPPISAEMGIEGRVTLRMVITKEGDIKDIHVIRGVSTELDLEAVRIVESMPKWKSGRQNGEAVDVYFYIPIVFRIPQ
ncbi:TonB family protein [Dysgonomonas sp. PFB1-18]|uniref:energy transducer TonB n=1 Tax=unclassified Dysgonomonas TaxID=2630389 RepID=UPI002475BF4A|nr:MULTISPECIES: energy transducer TonB [unclassified Dysgonomonas]MDH6308311.1 TonB family protein [Dysgonomonas sp. PF1-14]MDH6338251.1 TonB family protein [Dysgonomonas sp. PF1-16]MDH6379748.1 TonB family protein [Dysgonomonas sp. PFB1-18]MDH6397162.1 TonB family protein [Dysgonomonas sp. PF1-23]